MKEILMRCWKNNQLVALYRDAEDLNGFDCCKIIFVNKDAVVASFFSVDGANNGLSSFYMNEIVMIEEDSQYLRALEKIARPGEPINLVAADTSLMPLIKYAKDNQCVTSIEVAASEDAPRIRIVGKIQEISKDTATLAEFDLTGKADGLNTVYLSDIQSVTIGSSTERRVEKLLKKANQCL